MLLNAWHTEDTAHIEAPRTVTEFLVDSVTSIWILFVGRSTVTTVIRTYRVCSKT